MENPFQTGLRGETSGAGRVFYAAGEVSITTASRLRVSLLEGLVSAGNDVLNLAGVEGADLSGLQLLYSAARSWQERGGQLKFEAVPEPLRALAEKAGYPAFETFSQGGQLNAEDHPGSGR
jgi:anti-anti-sigma regulatory factor